MLDVMDRLGNSKQPVAHIAVERVDRREKDSAGAVARANLTLHYRVIENDGYTGETRSGSFSASYCAMAQAISLTSGAVFLEPDHIQGHRVGTYLMNEIVTWAKQWPQAMVNSINLNAGQADKDNKARRNRFYEQFNLTFVYTDDSHKAGTSLVMPASQLEKVSSWKKKAVAGAECNTVIELTLEHHAA